jgi:enoyl-CoA hydratase
MTLNTMKLSVNNAVARLTLNRSAEFNTMNRAFWGDMINAFAAIENDERVRVVVLDAEGKHYSAGLDLNEFGDLAISDDEPARRAEQLRRMILTMQETFSVIDRCRVPVLAAIQGGCIGGGIDMISACDMRYCSADAFFTIQEINIGITADVGTLQRLPHILPQGLVRELAYTGRRMGAEEAFQRGLVNQVYPDHETLLAGVEELAQEIARKSPLAMTGTKEILNYARDHSIAEGLNYVATWNAAMLSRADLAEAFTSKAEKRQADYQDLLPSRKLV